MPDLGMLQEQLLADRGGQLVRSGKEGQLPKSTLEKIGRASHFVVAHALVAKSPPANFRDRRFDLGPVRTGYLSLPAQLALDGTINLSPIRLPGFSYSRFELSLVLGDNSSRNQSRHFLGMVEDHAWVTNGENGLEHHHFEYNPPAVANQKHFVDLGLQCLRQAADLSSAPVDDWLVLYQEALRRVSARSGAADTAAGATI